MTGPSEVGGSGITMTYNGLTSTDLTFSGIRSQERHADYTAIWQLMAAEKAKIGEMISQWPTIQELRILMKGYAV